MSGVKNGAHNNTHYLPKQRCLLNQNERFVSTVLRMTEGLLVLFLLSACFTAELLTPDGRLMWSYRASILQHWFVHMKDFLTQLLTMKWQGKHHLI